MARSDEPLISAVSIQNAFVVHKNGIRSFLFLYHYMFNFLIAICSTFNAQLQIAITIKQLVIIAEIVRTICFIRPGSA